MIKFCPLTRFSRNKIKKIKIIQKLHGCGLIQVVTVVDLPHHLQETNIIETFFGPQKARKPRRHFVSGGSDGIVSKCQQQPLDQQSLVVSLHLAEIFELQHLDVT